MKNLITAIYSKATGGGNTFTTALGGRIYFNEAAQRADMPYSVFSLVSAVPEYYLQFRHESVLVQFNIFDESRSAVNVSTYAGYCKDLFDDCAMTVTGYTMILFEREQERVLRNDMTENTWLYNIQYRVTLSK